MATTRPSKNKPADLGQMLVNIYESGYLDKNQAYKQSFIKGMVGGFGGVLGATILVALFIWLLTLFGHVSLVRPVVDRLRHTVQTQENSAP